ncbi:MAG TPA: carboxypeptidase-like regulatory domain-containing protein [Thermoanaerobaculia bacterium]|nr:carboxypeptidase-like regulatory domain-containing protein [Thermoanaerobaculia bacterium]
MSLLHGIPGSAPSRRRRRPWRWLPVLLALGVPAVAAAEPVPLSLVVDAAGWPIPLGPPAKAVVELTWRGGCGGPAPSSSTAQREIELTAPGTVTVDLPARSYWQARVRSDAVWASDQQVATEGGAIELRVTPAVRLDARIEFPPGAQPLTRATVRYTVADSKSSPAEPQETLCPIDDDGLLRCVIPPGVFDLRIELGAPFAPVDKWLTALAPSYTAHLPPLRAERAASFTGRVEAEAARLPGDTVVELRRYSLTAISNSDSEEHLLGRASQTTRASADGSFELTGIAPGWFTVRAVAPGFEADAIGPFEIPEGKAASLDAARPFSGYAELPRSLLLRRTLELRTRISPPLDPAGRPWHVSLSSRLGTGPGSPHGEADGMGVWSWAGLPPGRYELCVGAPGCAQWVGPGAEAWARQEVELGPDPQPVAISIPWIPIEGRLTRRGQPLAAQLAFGWHESRLNVILESDQDGRFRGALPREGEWLVQVLVDFGRRRETVPVEVRRAAGSPAGPAQLEVRLPAEGDK